MKKFIVTEQQIQQLASVFMDFPAKNVLPAIDLLRNLPLLDNEQLELDKKPD